MPESAAPPERWDAATALLVDYMLDHDAREMPAEALGDFRDEADRMVDAAVLVHGAGGYAFFHEGYLDYLAAQRFLEGGRDLLNVVLSGEQGLTRRRLVRQVLQLQQDRDFEAYIRNVQALLARGDVRFHLKNVVFSVLAASPSPTSQEWKAVAKFIDDPQAHGHPAAWRIVTHPQWFDLLDSIGVARRWADAQSEAQADMAVSLLRANAQQRPDRVAELAKTKLQAGDRWNHRLRWLISYADLAAAPGFVDLAVYLVENGLLDIDGRVVPRDVLISAHRLPEANPEGSVRLLASIALRAWEIAGASEPPDPFSLVDGVLRASDDEQLLKRTAASAPASFAAALLPMIIDVAEANQSTKFPPYRDTIWGYRYVGERTDFGGQLIWAMVKAVTELAVSEPQQFDQAMGLLMEHPELETALLLLYRGWRAAPVRYADAALEFLSVGEEHLAVGYTDNPYWETEQLISAVAEHGSREALDRLELFLLDFYSWWERLPENADSAGAAQAQLLSAIPDRLQSKDVKQRLSELEKKFAVKGFSREPQPVRVGFVHSPISSEEAEDMDDGAWIAAILDHSGAESQEFSSDLVGGARELAQVLEALTKNDPERFANLILEVPDEADAEYFNGVLRAIATTDKELDPQSAFAAVRRCDALPDRPCGRWISGPIVRFADQDIPEDLIAVVAWYMTQDPDPDRDLWKADEPTVYYGGDPYMAGINSTRGAAAEGMAKLLWSDQSRLKLVHEALEEAVDDRTIAVRSCVANALLAVLASHPDDALELFARLVQTDDELLATQPAEQFVHWAVRSTLEEMRPLLRRMMGSERDAVRQAGGRQASLAALFHEGASDLAEDALGGDVALRRGAAEVFAKNVQQAQIRDACVEGLIRLFQDDDAGVREEAATCFRTFADGELGEYTALVDAFVGSSAFADGYDDLLDALADTTADLSEEAVAAGEAFVRLVGQEAADLRTRTARLASVLAKVIIRAYNRVSAAQLRERALDVIDELLANQAYGMDRALEEYESA
jgi:hypothetical protein